MSEEAMKETQRNMQESAGPLRIVMVGLDTSHVTAFTRLLHDEADPFHVPGARVVAAYPGGSLDFPFSIDRVGLLTQGMRDKWGVRIVESIAALKGEGDVVFVESVDGRVHLEQFREVMTWAVPVFIDKPLTTSSADAEAIAKLAVEHHTRIMSTSALRFAVSLQNALKDESGGAVTGADFYGPMPLIETLPGFFWYGIHAVEMLYATFGRGCREVRVTRLGDYDIIVAKWADGRIGSIRGNRTGNHGFGGVVHRSTLSRSVDLTSDAEPYYAGLLEAVLRFTRGEEVVALDESVEVMRFLEAANESVEYGGNSIIL